MSEKTATKVRSLEDSLPHGIDATQGMSQWGARRTIAAMPGVREPSESSSVRTKGRAFLDDAAAFGRRAMRSYRRRTGTTPPAPDPTGFYAPVEVGDGPRGEVLGTEPMAVGTGEGWRVRYRTLDAVGRPVVTSMAVAVPAGLAARPRPVVVWVHGAGGVAPGCGPSRTGLDVWYAEDYLRQGAVVVAPDLTGLGMEGTVHPYLHGTTAGRAVLDAARAASNLTTTGAGSVVAIAGHSAGGHAVLWANQLAAGADGDGLDVRLAVAMSPVVDLAVTMDHYSRAHGQGAFPVQLAATWPGVEPVDAAAVLTPAAMDRLDHLWSDRLERLVRVFDGPGERWVRADAFAHGAWATALEAQSAGRAPGAAAVLLVHGDADEAAPVEWSRRLAADTGAELREHRGADHMGIGPAARHDVVGAILAAMA
jgi:acetyl esterase/lipase